MKKASALHLARKRKDELEMKTKKATREPMRTGSATPPVASFKAGRAQEEKRPLGVGVSL
jgi:hypothetical protein